MSDTCNFLFFGGVVNPVSSVHRVKEYGARVIQRFLEVWDGDGGLLAGLVRSMCVVTVANDCFAVMSSPPLQIPFWFVPFPAVLLSSPLCPLVSSWSRQSRFPWSDSPGRAWKDLLCVDVTWYRRCPVLWKNAFAVFGVMSRRKNAVGDGGCAKEEAGVDA